LEGAAGDGLAHGGVEEGLALVGDVELGAVVEAGLALAFDGFHEGREVGGHGRPG